MVVNKPLMKIDSLSITFHEYLREKIFSLGKVKKHTALKNVSCSIDLGDRVAVIGRNGSGKSTLLKIMAGVDTDFNGQAEPLKGIRIGFISQTNREIFKTNNFKKNWGSWSKKTS